MYSPKITASKIEQVSRHFGHPFTSHSIEEVEFYNSHFKSITEFSDKGEAVGWKRNLTQDEQDYIFNETTIAKLDFNYWSTRYAFIENWEGKLARFSPNIAQRIILDVWGELEEKRFAISIQNLKARQLGVTTITQLAIQHRVQFYKHINAVVASSDPTRSRKMVDKIDLCWKNQPWWLMPKRTGKRVGELFEFGGMDSGIEVQWGNQTTGIARGSTPTCAHLSELCDFENPKDLVDNALLHGMHEHPDMFRVLESTAKGRHNWWHDMWEENIANRDSGVADFEPVFLPWFVGRDLYPSVTWLAKRPVPLDWKPEENTVDHARNAAEFVQTDPLLRRHLGLNWTMPREQMWYYEFRRAQKVRRKQLGDWLSEMPASAGEAFQSPHSNVFDAETTEALRNGIRNPVGVFAVTGGDSQKMAEILPTEQERAPVPELTVRAEWLHDAKPRIYKLIPLAFDGYYKSSPFNKLFVWEMPDEEEEYIISVDDSFGMGEDRAVVEVIRKGTPDRVEEQVAEFSSETPNLTGAELAQYCLAIGTFYANAKSHLKRQPQFVIEVNAGNGTTTQSTLQMFGWWNLYERVSSDNKQLQVESKKIGWSTNRSTRPKIMSWSRQALSDGLFIVNSPYYVDELGDLEWDEEKQKLGAAHGKHDDRFMALGIGLASIRMVELRGQTTPAWKRRQEKQAEASYYPDYSPPDLARDVPSDWLKENVDFY